MLWDCTRMMPDGCRTAVGLEPDDARWMPNCALTMSDPGCCQAAEAEKAASAAGDDAKAAAKAAAEEARAKVRRAATYAPA